MTSMNLWPDVNFTDLLGSSPRFSEARERAQRLAATGLPVLIEGESGTGKKLFAEAICSAGGKKPFCTDWSSGSFQSVGGGTVFLEHVEDLSAEAQFHLLQFLSDAEKSGIRILAAAGDHLHHLIEKAKFRKDLYYRLKAGYVHIPPLRERGEDIRLLAEHFVGLESGGAVGADEAVLRFFLDYDWPGNVRELRNLVRYMLAVRARPDRIQGGDLPQEAYFHRGRKGGEEQGTQAYLNMKEACMLLRAVEDMRSQGESAGRISLTAHLQKQGIQLTEAQVRGRLKRLAELGYVECCRGKLGTMVTPLGHSIIQE